MEKPNRSSLMLLVGMILAGMPTARAETGDLLETFEFYAAEFALHPTRGVLYATLTNLNSVAIIDTQTLTVIDTVFIGSNPRGLALSPDGSRLYVANGGSSYMGVLDTETNEALKGILLPTLSSDVEVGLDGRLYVTPTTSAYAIMQIDSETGMFVDDFDFGTSTARGYLEISPDRTSLYMGKSGGSPSQIAKFNVQSEEASFVYANPHGSLGSNGQGLRLNHRGNIISYPCGSGNGQGYDIHALSTTNFAVLGTFNTGAYPGEIAFSPDDALAYTVHTSGRIDRFSAKTYLPLPHIPIVGAAGRLVVDHTGRYLFASTLNEVRVYDTGVSCAGFLDCLDGPDAGLNRSTCICFDFTRDEDVDLRDVALHQVLFAGAFE